MVQMYALIQKRYQTVVKHDDNNSSARYYWVDGGFPKCTESVIW